jgi:choline monooxygenase
MNIVNLPIGDRGAMSDNASSSCTLPSKYYFDAGIFQRERQAIFHRNWCYVGHIGQLAKPEDYFVDSIVDQPIFLIRVDDNSIKGYMNVCQHRGHQLLTGSGSGKKRIVCPYHAWTYDLDGSLIRAPCTDELPSFKPDSFGLKEIAVAECAGLLFANLTPVSTKHEASVFEDVYPGLKNTLTGHLGNLEGFERKHRIDYQIAANWKVVVDNFSEGYHIPMAHRLLSQVLDSAASSDSRIEKHYAFFESICKSGYAGLDLEPGQPYLSWTIWPNTCMLSQPGCKNLFVIRMAPDGPAGCAERVDILAPAGESAPELDALKTLFADNFNKEDIAIVESVQRGLQSLGYDQSRYVADGKEDWYSESGLHRFHMRIIEALEIQQ